MKPVYRMYLNAGIQRTLAYKPLGEICLYCCGVKPEQSITGYRVCSSCGAEMPKPLALCFGMPVYDSADACELMTDNTLYAMNIEQVTS